MIPFIDLKAQFRRLEPAIRRRIEAVLEHGQFIMGPEVEELEDELAAFAGVRRAVGCASGTDALLLVLRALGIGPGDCVLTTPLTFAATAEVVALTGATPVFVDVTPDDFTIDAQGLGRALLALERRDPKVHPLPCSSTRLRPRAVITVDLFGLPCDYDRIAPIAEAHCLPLIVDAAQSFGATHGGRPSCSLGLAGCTSFFPAKPLGCYGDGGAVLTHDENLANLVASIRVHGQGQDRYEHARLGMCSRLDTFQAAVLLAKLPAFPNEIERRRHLAQEYGRLLSPLAPVLTPQAEPAGRRSVFAHYSLLAASTQFRERIRSRLAEAGVPTQVYYPRPLHLQPAFSGLGYRPGDMPTAEDLSVRIFSLPLHPYMEDGEAERIASLVAEAME